MFQIPDQMSIPLPMVTIMQNGRAAPGKLNCVKEFMVIPKHDMPLKKVSIKHVSVYIRMMLATYTQQN